MTKRETGETIAASPAVRRINSKLNVGRRPGLKDDEIVHPRYKRKAAPGPMNLSGVIDMLDDTFAAVVGVVVGIVHVVDVDLVAYVKMI